MKLEELTLMALLGDKKNIYLLDDRYSGETIPAGSVNGTLATPGGTGSAAQNTRTPLDTNSKISVGSGVLDFATGAAVNDALWYGLFTRAAGRLMVAKMILADVTSTPQLGWDSAQSGAILDMLKFTTTTGIQIVANGAAVLLVGAYTATTYYVAIVMRSTGIYWFIKGGLFTNWTLLWYSAVGSADAYPAIQAGSAIDIFTADDIRVPLSLWLPTPLAYDTFTRANGAIGSSEAVGPDSQATPVRVWTGATWTIATNKAVNTPATLGAEDVANGNMETGDPPSNWTAGGTAVLDGVADERTGGSGIQSISIKAGAGNYPYAYQALDNPAGTWVYITAWGKRILNASAVINTWNSAITGTQFVRKLISSGAWASGSLTSRCLDDGSNILLRNDTNVLNDEANYDDISVKPLTLSELISSVQVSNPNIIASVDITNTSVGYQGGLCVRLDSTSAPANFIIAYLNCTNGTSITNLRLDKCVAGVYTNLISATITYSAAASLRIVADGSKVTVYYNNLIVGTTQTVSDAGILNNTLMGKFSTDVSYQFDNFTLMPVGGGAYDVLDKYIR